MKEFLRLNNDISEVPQLAEWVEQLCEKYDLSPSAVFQLNLALEEAVVNVMNYAYPGQTGMPVMLSACKCDDAMVFTLEDNGLPFDPTASDEPDLSLPIEERPIGGLGIFLVRQIMTNVSYVRREDTNVLTMTYSIR